MSSVPVNRHYCDQHIFPTAAAGGDALGLGSAVMHYTLQLPEVPFEVHMQKVELHSGNADH